MGYNGFQKFRKSQKSGNRTKQDHFGGNLVWNGFKPEKRQKVATEGLKNGVRLPLGCRYGCHLKALIYLYFFIIDYQDYQEIKYI